MQDLKKYKKKELICKKLELADQSQLTSKQDLKMHIIMLKLITIITCD